MNQNVKFIALFLVFASLATMALGFIPEASAAGPATSNLLIKLYVNQLLGEAALANGNIDIESWPLSNAFIAANAGNPSITMDGYAEIGMTEFDLDDQLWPTGPITTPRTGAKNGFFDPNGVRDIAALHFRRATAHLANKDFYTTTIMGGYGYVMETIVPVPALEGFTDYWTLTNSTANADPWSPGLGGYIYGYSPTKAAQEFDLGGFRFWTDGTPGVREWRDPGPDKVWSNGNSPDADDGAIEAWPNMNFRAPQGDIYRIPAGLNLFRELVAAGIPAAIPGVSPGLVWLPTPPPACLLSCMVNYDYNIYVGGWSVSANPGFIFDLLHSTMGQYSYALNYPGFKNHDFDPYAERIKYAAAGSDIRSLAIQAQWVANKYCPIVWLWCARGVKGYRTGWQNVINQNGYGIDNFWTFDLMNRTGYNAINCGLLGIPSDLNIVTSGDSWPELVVPQADALLPNAKVLSCIYDSLLRRNPYNLAEEVGALATSWSATASYPGWEGKTVCEFTVRTDATFHDGTPVEPADIAYSMLLVKAAGAGNAWNYPAAMDIDHVQIAGDVVRVFFGVQAASALHWSGFMPIINKDLWNSAIGPGTAAGYTGFITDGVDGNYYPGTFTNPYAIRAYWPWVQNANGNAIIDLSEDGSGPWVYAPFQPPGSIALNAYTGFYNTISRQKASGPSARLTIGTFLNVAFHEIGNVNYPGGYGVAQGWYTADRVIDLIGDLARIAKSLTSTSGGSEWGPGAGQYNPDADLDNNGVVNVIDLGTAGANFGKTMG